MAFWARKTRVVVKNLPMKEFFNDIKKQFGMSKKEFCEAAVCSGIDLLMHKYSKDIEFKRRAEKETERTGLTVGKEAPQVPVVKESPQPQVGDCGGSDDMVLGRTGLIRGSKVPRNCFRVCLHPSHSYLTLGITFAEPLIKAGYHYFTIGHNQCNNKTFIVFSREGKVGFKPVRVEHLHSTSRRPIYRVLYKSQILNLGNLLGVKLQHGQIINIVSHDVKGDGDLWIEVKAGETQN